MSLKPPYCHWRLCFPDITEVTLLLMSEKPPLCHQMLSDITETTQISHQSSPQVTSSFLSSQEMITLLSTLYLTETSLSVRKSCPQRSCWGWRKWTHILTDIKEIKITDWDETIEWQKPTVTKHSSATDNTTESSDTTDVVNSKIDFLLFLQSTSVLMKLSKQVNNYQKPIQNSCGYTLSKTQLLYYVKWLVSKRCTFQIFDHSWTPV